MRKTAVLAVATIINCGCASIDDYMPIADDAAPEVASKLLSDLAACKELAAKVNIGAETALSVITAGLGSAVVGFAFGSLSGAAGKGALFGGVPGAAAGFVNGVEQAKRTQKDVVRACLIARGHRIYY
jgi:hypothetical protein